MHPQAVGELLRAYPLLSHSIKQSYTIQHNTTEYNIFARACLKTLDISAVERVQFRATISTERISASGRVIQGLALPYGEEASPVHPAFAPGVLVDYGHPKPLLLEHDITACVGEVKALWETPEGVHFVAALNEPAETLPRGLSVGGEYIVDGGIIKALYIYEISLTNSPAYSKTNYTIMATKLTAQEEDRVTALEGMVSALTARVNALEERVAAIENTMKQQAEAVQEAVSAAKAATKDTQTLLASVRELVDEKYVQALSKLNEHTEKVFDILTKTIRK